MKAQTTNAASTLLNNLMGGQTITREKFAQLVIAKFKAHPQVTDVTYDATEFSVETIVEGTDKGSTTFLQNAYRQYCGAPVSMRSSIIEQWVNSMLQVFDFDPRNFDEAKARLMPVIRSGAYCALQEAEAHFATPGSKDAEAEHRAVGNLLQSDATVFLCLDLPLGIMSVSEKNIAQWGIDRAELYKIALENLKQKSANHSFTKIAPGVFKATFNDCYDSSRILLPETFKGLQINGDPVAMIPCRDSLLVAGSNDQRGIATMMKIAAKQIEDDPYSLTASAFRFHGKEAEVFFPETMPPVILRSMLSLIQDAHHSQGEVLKKHMSNVFVGSLLVQHQQDGHGATMAAWAPNNDSALCRAHYINLINVPDKKVMCVPWAVAEEHFGELLTSMNLVPARYLTKGYPSPEVMKTLESVPGVQTISVPAGF